MTAMPIDDACTADVPCLSRFLLRARLAEADRVVAEQAQALTALFAWQEQALRLLVGDAQAPTPEELLRTIVRTPNAYALAARGVADACARPSPGGQTPCR